MEHPEKFCLRWTDFETNIGIAFRELREEKDLFNVTIACDDDRQIQAHQVILSASSSFFRNVLRRNPHQHPLLYLKGLRYRELQSIIDFMYMGEVNVAQEDLDLFLSAAEDLKVKGLIQNKLLPENQGLHKDSRENPNKVKRLTADPTPPTAVNQNRVNLSPPLEVKKPMDHETQVKSEPRDLTTQTTSVLPKTGHFETKINLLLPESENYQQDKLPDDEDFTGAEQQKEYQITTPATNKAKLRIKTRRINEKVQTIKPKEVKQQKPKVLIKPVGACQAWQCEVCEKIFSARKHAVQHMQDEHQ